MLLAAAAALDDWRPVAHAGWDPARATRQPFKPFAAAAPGGAFTLWGTGPGARRLTLPATTSTPLGFSSARRMGRGSRTAAATRCWSTGSP